MEQVKLPHQTHAVVCHSWLGKRIPGDRWRSSGTPTRRLSSGLSRRSQNRTSAGSSSRTRVPRGSCRRRRWEGRRTCRTRCQPRKPSCASHCLRQSTPPRENHPRKGIPYNRPHHLRIPPGSQACAPTIQLPSPIDTPRRPRSTVSIRDAGTVTREGRVIAKIFSPNAAPCSRTPFVHISVRARHDVSVVRNRGCPFQIYRVSDDRPRRRFPLVDVPFLGPSVGFEQGDALTVAGELTGVRVDLLAVWTEPGVKP